MGRAMVARLGLGLLLLALLLPSQVRLGGLAGAVGAPPPGPGLRPPLGRVGGAEATRT